MMANAIIIDVETSSLYGEVIELAYAEVDGTSVSDPVTMRFKPSEEFDPRAVAVHGILPSDVCLCPPSGSAMSRIPEAKYWIGHNVIYDWERLGRPPEVRLVCTLRLAEMVWPKLSAFKLSQLYVQLFGMNPKTVSAITGLHGAGCDVKLTANVLWRIMKDTGVSCVSQLPYMNAPGNWNLNPIEECK